MQIYLYNNDFSEQSIRQMQTIIPFLEVSKIFVNKGFRDWFGDSDSIEYINFNDFLNIDKKKAIIYFKITDGYFLRKYKNTKNLHFIFRPRGLMPEESFYKHKNWFRKLLLNYMERKVIMLSDYFIFLEHSQRVHFLSKYQGFTSKFDNFSIVPNVLNDTHFESNELGQSNDETIKIVYSGGFSKWQHIELIFTVISRIVKNIEETSNEKVIFKILTFESNFIKARNLAAKYNISEQLELKYVTPKELSKELRKSDIGIIIRDSNIVNMAASPFKVIDYITNGLGIITTNNISNQVKSLLGNGDYIFELDFINGQIECNDDNILEFISKIKAQSTKETIISNYENFQQSLNKINFDREFD